MAEPVRQNHPLDVSERKVNPQTLALLIGYLRDAPEQQEVHSEAISTRSRAALSRRHRPPWT